MSELTYAIAQIENSGDSFERNAGKHEKAIACAAGHGADFLLFPEMSLTGYQRDTAERNALTLDDARLQAFSSLAQKYGMRISAGAPLRHGGRLFIAALIFLPDGTRTFYAKKHLHPGEDEWFSPGGEYDPVIQVRGEKIAHAICYDIENADHADCAARSGANVYAASIFYSKKGIAWGLERLGAIARDKKVSVLMANYAGSCWNTESGGMSAIWSDDGSRIAEAGASEECLLIGRRANGSWTSEIALF